MKSSSPTWRAMRSRDLAPAVADLAGAEMAAGVEQLATLDVPDVRALGADDHPRVLVRKGGLELAEVGEEVTDRVPARARRACSADRDASSSGVVEINGSTR